ncbi:hypothetical protein [Microbacterium sp.]|uniref:hypothetical protein n=1 Tax=Microbacterium sp. TaxID=51671 RepID=UPI0027336823|nr:hypothetical protein [Microbacterium sp.]MDP3949922.1 hypothetical protein [Microbacterium sp.]
MQNVIRERRLDSGEVEHYEEQVEYEVVAVEERIDEASGATVREVTSMPVAPVE